MYDCAVRRSIKPRLGGLRKWRVATRVLRGGIGRGERVRPFGIPFCVTSGPEAFGTGVSGFRPPALPFSREGWMVVVNELAVRECLCPCPGLGDAKVVLCLKAEKVEELWERDVLGGGVGSTGASECWLDRFLVFYFQD